MIEKIERILDARVRPTLRSHGGDVRVQCVKDGVVVVKLLGQCSTCPSSLSTAKNVILAELAAALPEIAGVELDCGVAPEMLSFAREILKKA